jgi:hypothetical protein
MWFSVYKSTFQSMKQADSVVVESRVSTLLMQKTTTVDNPELALSTAHPHNLFL